MISNNLLGKVLEMEVCNNMYDAFTEEIIYEVGLMHQDSIDIYKLAHLCKEWAYKQGYSISTMREVDEDKFWYYDIWGMDMLSKHESSLNKSEVEAVFKACEWILKEKG